MTPGLQIRQRALDSLTTSRLCAGVKWSGKSTPSSAARRRNGKPVDASVVRARQPDRQPELDRELEVDVEELGPQLHRPEMRREMGDVEAPQDRSLDLDAALAPDLVEIGVVPEVVDGAGEPALAVEQRGGVGDGSPAVQLVLGVEREMHADVLAPVLGGGFAGPRGRDHERGARGHSLAERVVDADVGGMARAEIVAADDQHAVVRPIAEPLGQSCHGRKIPAAHVDEAHDDHNPRPARRASATAARNWSP